MSKITKRQQQAKTLRSFRKIHRTMGVFLFVFFFIIALSGVLLGWKKNSNSLILPKTQVGTSTELRNWLSLKKLNNIADKTLLDTLGKDITLSLNRIDIRKEKGIAKFIYKHNNYGIQIDGVTGKVLSIGKRHSDAIENLHDGSIVDEFLGTNGYFKLFYTTAMGIALLLFTITGFWLWYGPKRMRK